MSKKIVSMQLNGKAVEEAVEPRTLLIHFLREKMSLTGAYIGCETSHCGACTVTKVSGEVEMENNDVLEPDDLAEGLILACQAHPLSDEVEVTYDD